MNLELKWAYEGILADKMRRTMIKLYGHDIDRDGEELINELAVFLKLKFETVERLLHQAYDLSAEEWKEKVIDHTVDNLYAFYSSSKYYIFDLCYSNYGQLGTYLGNIAIAKSSKGRVLDYGGGIGSHLIMAWNAGLRDLTYYDIKGKLFDFAEYRFRKRNMNVKMIAASDYKDRLEGTYDTIILKEVLEHVMNPLFHLERLDRHLARGSRLFLSHPPKKYEWVPMDFELNIRDVDNWLKYRGYKLKRLKLFHTIPVRRIKLYTKAP